MGPVKRDGFYKRGRYWWTRDPVTKTRCSTGCTDREAAGRWRAARERIAADPTHAAAELATLGEWAGRFVAMKRATKSAATAKVAEQKLGHWIRIFGADAPLSTFADPNNFDVFVDQRRSENVTDHTISKEVAHQLAVLKLAKRGGCFAGDVSTLRPPDLHAGYEPRTRTLTREELVRLLAQLPPRRASLIAICVALGCRLSEAFKLLPTDIDWTRGRVFVGGTKTKKARRYVPILSLFRPLLEAAAPHLPIEPWGKVWRDIKAACQRAGIEPCSPNDLRRTHATLLAEAGVDADVTRRLLGHTTRQLVDQVYGQPSTEALAGLAEERLQLAAPLLAEYNDVTVQGVDDEKKAKAPVAQWIEQRFPKPNSPDLDPPSKTENSEKDAESASPAADADPPESLAAGTTTSQQLTAGEASVYAARPGLAAARADLARMALAYAAARALGRAAS